MNPLFNMLMGGGNPMQQSMPNPVGQFSRAPMQNPAQFVRSAIPDLPTEIANDPKPDSAVSETNAWHYGPTDSDAYRTNAKVLSKEEC